MNREDQSIDTQELSISEVVPCPQVDSEHDYPLYRAPQMFIIGKAINLIRSDHGNVYDASDWKDYP
jgi:hypothetical protein